MKGPTRIHRIPKNPPTPLGVLRRVRATSGFPIPTLPRGHLEIRKIFPRRGGGGGGTKVDGPPGRHRALQDHLLEAAGTLYIRYRYFKKPPRRSKMLKTTPWTPPRAAQDGKMEPRSTQKPLIFFGFSVWLGTWRKASKLLFL